MFQRLSLMTLLVLITAGCQPRLDRVTLTISGGASGRDLDLTVAGTQRFMAENPDIRVLVIPTPSDSTERLAYYRNLLSGQSDEVDVLEIDVVWIGIVAEHALDLNGFIPREKVERHIPSIIENNSVGDRLVAMPWFADAPSLFYRTDLLAKYGYSSPPGTWQELESMARQIMDGERRDGNLGFWGYVWQGRAYEGLTCNALEWQLSHGGGNFIDAADQPHLSNPGAVAAFQMGRNWVGGISPAEVLEFDEEDSRLLWQRGDAAFLRNWSYVYSLTREAGGVGRNFAVAALPSGPEGRAATLGGWQLMASAHSRFPKEAAALVEFLTDENEQKLRAIEGSYIPTIPSLYSDADVLNAVPFFEGFEQIYRDLVVRPSSQLGSRYHEVSSTYSSAVFDILSGQEPTARLEEAEQVMSQFLTN